MDKNGQNKNCNKIEYCLGSGLELLSAPRAIALWRDETSDKKHEEIRRLSSSLIEKNPKVLSRFSSLRTLWRNMSRTARSRELGQKLWTYSVVHHS